MEKFYKINKVLGALVTLIYGPLAFLGLIIFGSETISAIIHDRGQDFAMPMMTIGCILGIIGIIGGWFFLKNTKTMLTNRPKAKMISIVMLLCGSISCLIVMIFGLIEYFSGFEFPNITPEDLKKMEENNFDPSDIKPPKMIINWTEALTSFPSNVFFIFMPLYLSFCGLIFSCQLIRSKP